MNKRNSSLLPAILITLFSVTCAVAQTGPGGVGNNTNNFLLLKSSAGTSTTTNGVTVSAWNDQSGNANNVTQATAGNQPTYKTNQLNGLPSLYFNGSNNLIGPSNFPSGTDYTKFVVGRVFSTSSNNNFFSGTNNHAFYLSSGSLNPKLFHNGAFVNSSIALTLNTFALMSGTFNTTSKLGEVFVNGSSGGTGTAAGTNSDGAIQIGSYSGGNYLQGDVTEVIGYSFLLNTAQRTIVENYLAAKYALSISNLKYNYAATHPNDVIGIGRTSATSTQLVSKSAKILDLSQPAAGSFTDGDYFLAGHDGVSVAAWTAVETPSTLTNIQRLPREWRVTKTGATSTMTVGIDNTTLPAFPASYTKYVIMVDADGDFTSGALVYELPSIGGAQYALAGLNVPDGSFLAVGVVNPTIQFTSTTTAQFENISQPVPVFLNYITSSAVSVNYTSAAGTATLTTDWSLAGTSVTIAAGTSSNNINPAIVNDALVENDETFTITISSPSAGITLGPNTVNTYTIHDDDNARKIDFSTAAPSGSESVTTVNLTIRINNVDAVNPTRVDYSVTGGTATGGGVDYTLASGTATVAANATTTTLSFTVVDDAIYELNETIIITLTNPTNSNLGTNNQITYTINDNDGLPVVGFSGTSASGVESTAAVNFPVVQSINSYTSSQVNYTVTGTATGGGVDYTLSNGTLVIPAGSNSANIVATVVNDAITEASETIIVTLSSPVNCTLGTTVYTYTILDDDPFGWTGPGGVGDNLSNILWLRADLGTGTTTDGTAVTTWTDQSGNGTNATQATVAKRPIFKTAQLNGLPAVRFDGSNSFMTCPSVFPTNNNYSKVVVARMAASATNNIISGSSGHALFYGSTTTPLLFHGGTFLTSSISVPYGNFALITGTFLNSTKTGQLFVNGTSGGSATTSNANTDATLQIGSFGGANLMNGDISEGIAYNTLLNSAQRTLVENYLSSKYGVAISNDKYSFDASFGNEVAGIGRDDGSNLHLDAKGTGLVRINTASSLDDGDYLVWGHNGASLGSGSTTDVPAGIVSRMNRVWRAAQTANVGTVSISFDLTGLTVGSGNDIELLLDADGVFASGATRFTTGRGYNSTTHIISFTGLTLPDGTYFTLGSNNPATTLPIHLLSFTAVADRDNNAVQLQWQTATEIDNDYFMVERSGDGAEWVTLERIRGAGTSLHENNYAAKDISPLPAQSFYRLGQTDLNGKISFSNMVAVNFGQADFLEFYPNPANETITISVRRPAPVSILSATGRVYFSQQVSEPVHLQTKDLPDGVYIVRSFDAGTVVTRKLVIQH